MIGVTVSALRAVVMFVLRVIADMSGRVYDTLTAVSLSAVIVIVWRPLSFYDGGFQLSFGAIIGILFLNPMIWKQKKNKSFLYNSIVANLSILIITFPIPLYHYYEFPLYSTLLNLIVVPLMSVVLLLTVLGIFSGIIWFTCGKILLQGSVWILEGYEWLCNLILYFPNARVVTGQPKMWGIVMYYACLSAAIGMSYQMRKNKGRKSCLIMPLLVGMLGLFISCPQPLKNELEVTMLDVGQGDCFFVQQDDFTCLIDGGSSSEKHIAKYRIEPFLKYKGVDELNYVFVSHGDTDHINGIQEMVERQREGVRIKTMVFPEQSVWDEALWELAGLAKEQEINVRVMSAGEVLQKGHFQMKCLWPSDDVQRMALGNETSLVLGVSYMDFDMLFTGDVERGAEEKLTSILKKQYDVLKIAHHGSKNSTSDEFLDIVKPKIGLVSAGKNNSYGHPHEETVKRLEGAECRMLNTAESGAVSIKVTKTVAKLKVFQYNNCYEKFE